jgi:hypothetical protein
MSPDDSPAEVRPLACPRCTRKYTLDERFCSECGMPLVYVGREEEQPITASHERARKIKPQYTGGQPVRVASASNLAEAELIQGMLLEAGVPSLVRRSGGFDVPDFLAAGPRDILVPRGGEDTARAVLGSQPGAPPRAEAPRRPRRAWVRALAFVLAALVIALVATGVIVAILGG